MKTKGKDQLIFVVYVDYIIFGGNKYDVCKEFTKEMQKEFEMSLLGVLLFFLELQITQSNKGIFISQTMCIKEMLKKFEMEDCKSVSTPMITGCKLSKEDESKQANKIQYRSKIGILLYVTTSRLYIMQEVELVARFQDAPKETHVQVVKMIFRYLKGTLDFGLWYPTSKKFTLTTHIDAYWEGSLDDKNNTNGGALFLGNILVSWLNKKQSSIPLCTIEEKYIEATTCCTQVLRMKQTLKDIKVEYNQPISILCDNTSAINISKNLVMHSKTKHITIKYHFLRDQFIEQNVNMEYISTKKQVIDIFKKPLPRETFEHLRQKLGVVPMPSNH
jgi:hypothetical protein